MLQFGFSFILSVTAVIFQHNKKWKSRLFFKNSKLSGKDMGIKLRRKEH